MKRAHKKIFGFLGLGLVVAVTIFAACLPAQETQATTSVTDTITVRVVGETPNVVMMGIESGTMITSPDQSINVSYENVETLVLSLKYTDKDGNEYTVPLLSKFVDYIAGDLGVEFDLLNGKYSYDGQTFDLPYFGYGDYVITASGEGYDGATRETFTKFSYYPVTATTRVDNEAKQVYIDLDYAADDGTEAGEGKVAKVVINIYDKDGNLVPGLSPIEVDAPDKQVAFNPEEYGLESGTYTVEVIAYDRNGDQLYKPYYTEFVYEEEVIPVPDTGGLLGNLNISKTDYLITGLLIFFLVGVSGAIFIARRGKNTTKRRK